MIERIPEFIDSADAPNTASNELSSRTNKNFGRRFVIVSFRYLNSPRDA